MGGDSIVLRVGLLAAAALLLRDSFSLILGEAPLIAHKPFLAVIVLGGAAAFTLFGLAALRTVPPRAVWLILAVALLDVALRGWVFAANAPNAYAIGTVDGALADFGGRLLLRGHNPYTLDAAAVPALYALDTPLTLASHYPYPALSVLLAAPFGAFWLSLLAYGGLLVLIFTRAPATFRPVILLPLLAADVTLFSRLAIGGALGPVWALMLVGALFSGPRRSALLAGSALAVHPVAGLALPLLLAERPRRVWPLWAGFAGGAFLLWNAPFIIWDAGAWWAGVTAWAHVDVLANGGGLAALSASGAVPLAGAFYRALFALLLIAAVGLAFSGGRVAAWSLLLAASVAGGVPFSVGLWWLAVMVVAVYADERPPHPYPIPGPYAV